ncbi:MAG TPA: tyrosine-type recombinase/integrase [Ktedonobacteraceae bacterium]|nr:tyrosine-type recombinase/integrase [Ktedonobacteraceae bacterium]
MPDDRFSHLPDVWQRCIADFLNSIEDISGSKGSRQNYRSTLALFFTQHQDPESVTRGDVTAFISSPSFGNKNKGKPRSVSSRNGLLTAISSLYTYASTYEVDHTPLFQKASPAQGLRHLKTPRAYRSMNESELAALFAAIDTSTVAGKRDYSLLLFYLISARRLSEIARLRLADLEETTIIDGNERRMAHIFHFRGKGKSREDDIAELPQIVYEAIDAYHVASERKATMTAESALFTSIYPGQGRRDGTKKDEPLKSSSIHLIFRKYARLAGLTNKSVHSLRHASAQIRFSQGETILSLKRTLRHSSLNTTFIYLQGLTSQHDKGADLIVARLPFLAQR